MKEHPDKKKSLRETIRIIYQCMKLSFSTSPLFFLLILIIEITQSILPFVALYLVTSLINLLTKIVSTSFVSVNDSNDAILLIIMIMIIEGGTRILFGIKGSIAALHRELISKKINLGLAVKSSEIDLSFFDSTLFYDELTNAKRDSQTVMVNTWVVIDLIRISIQFAIAFVMMINLSVLYTTLLLIFSIPMFVFQKKYTDKMYNLELNQVNANRKMNYLSGVMMSRHFAKDIRLYNIKNFFVEKYSNIWNNNYNHKRELAIKQSVTMAIVKLIPIIIYSILKIQIVSNIISGLLTVGSYYLYSGVIGELVEGINGLVTQISVLHENRLRFERYEKFMKLESKLSDHGNMNLMKIEKIEFKNVFFRYSDTSSYVLYNCSFQINDSEKVALAGLNGSGKSTVVKLILRFYEPSKGDILINGLNISDYSITSLRKQFSVMFQDYTNYAFTIKENILISSNKEINNSHKLNDVINSSSLSSDIIDLENGVDTYLTREFSDDGIELSGGQKQKIAIARTFYRDSNFLILDEPSASLDPLSEDYIFRKMNELSNNKTVLFISHKLSNIALADRILFLDKGKIVECGSHLDLIKMKGKYAELYSLQVSKYTVS